MLSLIDSFRRRRLSKSRRDDSLLLIEEVRERVTLPSSLPEWPSGNGFATGSILLGEIEVAAVSSFKEIWRTFDGGFNDQGATFFKPINIPDGYSCLGYYGQPNDRPLDGWVLVARSNLCRNTLSEGGCPNLSVNDSSSVLNAPSNKVTNLAALVSPLGYRLVWSTADWGGETSGPAYFWLPSAPNGYKALGYVISKTEDGPSLDEVMCVRADLTDTCVTDDLIWDTGVNCTVNFWSLRPAFIRKNSKGVPVGTFWCNTDPQNESSFPVACLKNMDIAFNAMPNLEQLHALIHHYGPTIVFHPDEVYFPSSVYWFFRKGAILYRKGEDEPINILDDGSNLPVGGTNDGQFWIDLPNNGSDKEVKKGDLSNAEVYVHVKPMLGGTFTDLATWVYYPFNGGSTAKVGLVNISLGKVGEHVSDWEHFTLRVSNFSGELWKIYFSQHSGGTWVRASELEYRDCNKAVIYSSKHGHPCYPHPGCYLQGDSRLGIGIRNDAAWSDYILDSSNNYQIVSAEHLNLHGHCILQEPIWLQYMREWGPKVQYDSRAELEKLLRKLPKKLRTSLLLLIEKLPDELSGEEGPTGPKEKNNWFGDER